MVEGIHILNETMVMGSAGWAICAMLGGLMMGIICILICCNVKNKIVSTVTGILSCTGILCFITIGIVNPEIETGRYRYECTIDESVSFDDIYERFEVIEQRGEIWVLEDKE